MTRDNVKQCLNCFALDPDICTKQNIHLYDVDNRLNPLYRKLYYQCIDNMLVFDNITYLNHTLYDVLYEYHKFLTVIFKSGNNFRNLQNKLSPFPVIDTIWHAHILDTESYVSVCAIITDNTTYLHHYIENGFMANQKGKIDRMKHTMSWYKIIFGNIPDNMIWVWRL